MERRDAVSVVVGLLVSLLVGAGPALGAAAEDGVQSGPAAAIGAARAAAAAETKRALETDAAAGELGRALESAAEGHAEPPADRAPEALSGAGAGAVPGHPAAPSTDPPLAALATPPETIPPAAETLQATSLYDPARHRDPFRGPNLVAPEGVAQTPLERYQIGQLKLVGVIWETDVPRAMVEDSIGLGYIVAAGTAIGSSGGVVRRIEPRRVLIEERVTDFYGEKQPREVVMELPEEDRSP